MCEYLVGDPPSIVFQGELREGHLGPGIQEAVTMVIVALLEESVVRCLATTRTRSDIIMETATRSMGGGWMTDRKWCRGTDVPGGSHSGRQGHEVSHEALQK